MSAWLTLRGAVAVPAVAAFGCGSPEPNLPDDTRWTSEHFVYRARTGDDTVCEGVLATLEKHFDAMQSYLGFSWPPGRVIQYFKFENIEDLKENSGCPPESGGCQREDRVFAADPMQEHELIHAYLHPSGLPPPLILEGIAQALSCFKELRTLWVSRTSRSSSRLRAAKSASLNWDRRRVPVNVPVPVPDGP